MIHQSRNSESYNDVNSPVYKNPPYEDKERDFNAVTYSASRNIVFNELYEEPRSIIRNSKDYRNPVTVSFAKQKEIVTYQPRDDGSSTYSDASNNQRIIHDPKIHHVNMSPLSTPKQLQYPDEYIFTESQNNTSWVFQNIEDMASEIGSQEKLKRQSDLSLKESPAPVFQFGRDSWMSDEPQNLYRDFQEESSYDKSKEKSDETLLNSNDFSNSLDLLPVNKAYNFEKKINHDNTYSKNSLSGQDQYNYEDKEPDKYRPDIDNLIDELSDNPLPYKKPFYSDAPLNSKSVSLYNNEAENSLPSQDVYNRLSTSSSSIQLPNLSISKPTSILSNSYQFSHQLPSESSSSERSRKSFNSGKVNFSPEKWSSYKSLSDNKQKPRLSLQVTQCVEHIAQEEETMSKTEEVVEESVSYSPINKFYKANINELGENTEVEENEDEKFVLPKISVNLHVDTPHKFTNEKDDWKPNSSHIESTSIYEKKTHSLSISNNVEKQVSIIGQSMGNSKNTTSVNSAELSSSPSVQPPTKLFGDYTKRLSVKKKSSDGFKLGRISSLWDMYEKFGVEKNVFITGHQQMIQSPKPSTIEEASANQTENHFQKDNNLRKSILTRKSLKKTLGNSNETTSSNNSIDQINKSLSLTKNKLSKTLSPKKKSDQMNKFLVKKKQSIKMSPARKKSLKKKSITEKKSYEDAFIYEPDDQENDFSLQRKAIQQPLPDLGIDWNEFHSNSSPNLNEENFIDPYPTVANLANNIESSNILNEKKKNDIFSNSDKSIADLMQIIMNYLHTNQSEQLKNALNAASTLYEKYPGLFKSSEDQSRELFVVTIQQIQMQAKITSWFEQLQKIDSSWQKTYPEAEKKIRRFPTTMLARRQLQWMIAARAGSTENAKKLGVMMNHMTERNELISVKSLGEWKLHVTIPTHKQIIAQMQASVTILDGYLNKLQDSINIMTKRLNRLKEETFHNEKNNLMMETKHQIIAQLKESVAFEKREKERALNQLNEFKRHRIQLQTANATSLQENNAIRTKIEFSREQLRKKEAVIKTVTFQRDALDAEQSVLGIYLEKIDLDGLEIGVSNYAPDSAQLQKVFSTYLQQSLESKSFKSWDQSRTMFLQSIFGMDLQKELLNAKLTRNLLVPNLVTPPNPRISVWWRYEDESPDNVVHLFEGCKIQLKSRLTSDLQTYIPSNLISENMTMYKPRFELKFFELPNEIPLTIVSLYYDWMIRRSLYTFVENKIHLVLDELNKKYNLPTISAIEIFLNKHENQEIPLQLFAPKIQIADLIPLISLNILCCRRVELLMNEVREIWIEYYPTKYYGAEFWYIPANQQIVSKFENNINIPVFNDDEILLAINFSALTKQSIPLLSFPSELVFICIINVTVSLARGSLIYGIRKSVSGIFSSEPDWFLTQEEKIARATFLTSANNYFQTHLDSIRSSNESFQEKSFSKFIKQTISNCLNSKDKV